MNRNRLWRATAASYAARRDISALAAAEGSHDAAEESHDAFGDIEETFTVNGRVSRGVAARWAVYLCNNVQEFRRT